MTRTQNKNMKKRSVDLVKEAARKAPVDPHDERTLSDQRDRTTGADQATREDMSADQPHTLVDTSDAPGTTERSRTRTPHRNKSARPQHR